MKDKLQNLPRCTFFYTHNEINNRIRSVRHNYIVLIQYKYYRFWWYVIIYFLLFTFRSSKDFINIHEGIIAELLLMLDSHNILVQTFRKARDKLKNIGQNTDVWLRLLSNRIRDARTYNLSSASEFATLIVQWLWCINGR